MVTDVHGGLGSDHVHVSPAVISPIVSRTLRGTAGTVEHAIAGVPETSEYFALKVLNSISFCNGFSTADVKVLSVFLR